MSRRKQVILAALFALLAAGAARLNARPGDAAPPSVNGGDVGAPCGGCTQGCRIGLTCVDGTCQRPQL